jgi:hypothetical protein
MRESGKETLDVLGLEGGWGCLIDGGRLDTGVAKGSLSKELAVGVVGRVQVAVVSAVQHACFKLEEEECCRRRAALRCKRFYLCGRSFKCVSAAAIPRCFHVASSSPWWNRLKFRHSKESFQEHFLL